MDRGFRIWGALWQIFALGSFNCLEKNDEQPCQIPPNLHQVPICVDQDSSMPTHCYLQGIKC
jgi:hypothetical protein